MTAFSLESGSLSDRVTTKLSSLRISSAGASCSVLPCSRAGTISASSIRLAVFLFDGRESFAATQSFFEAAVFLQSNVAKCVGLRQQDRLPLHQFQNRKKQADHGAAAALPVE